MRDHRIVFISCNIYNMSTKKSRCPKGTRRNNKTGECEEILRKQSGLPIEVSPIKNDSYKERIT